MAGILDRKERILDVILTEEGYRQMQNGDIRFSYATFSDKDSVYKSDENNVFESGSLNFRLESSNSFFDTVSPEIDLNRGGYNITLGDLNAISVLEHLNNLEDQEQTFLTASTRIASNVSDILKKHSILLTTSSLDDSSLTLKGNFSKDEFYDYNVNNETAETSIQDIVNSNELNLIKDDARFSDKLNFLYLPPLNKDGSTLGTYNNRQENRSKILVKRGIPEFNDNFIINSLDEIEKNNNIPRTEFFINKLKNKSNFVLQVFENDVENKNINKLVTVDHGSVSILDAEGRRSFKRVFSIGKLFQVEKNKSDPTLKESDKQLRITSFYAFTNIFTMVFEEEKWAFII